MSRFAAAEGSSSTSHLTATLASTTSRVIKSVAAVSIFPDQNFGWRVRASGPVGGLQPADQIEEGSTPCLQIVCCSALEDVTRFALQRTVADSRTLLEPPHDLLIEASHVDGRHPSLRCESDAIDRWLDRRSRSKLEIIRVQVRDIESFEPDCASAVLGQIDRRTASQNTSSQPWNTTIRPMKRTPGNCRASRSSARYRWSCAVASAAAAATPDSSTGSPR